MPHCYNAPVRGLQIGTVATPTELQEWARKSLHESPTPGKRLVVGALITDGEGRIFVQRRTKDRLLFPGCWDIVGGHVEDGETMMGALVREVREETGWHFEELGPVVELIDWQGSDGAQRSEVDLLIKVEGDLTRPKLEVTKHNEWRWVAEADLPVLAESREADDLWVRDTVARALTLAQGWRH